MTHDETVERVARALNALWCPTCQPYEHTGDAHRAYCEKSARTAIAAYLSALPPRELLRDALDALEVFADLLEPEDESRPDGWMSHVFLDLRSVRRARAAADKIRAALTQEKQT